MKRVTVADRKFNEPGMYIVKFRDGDSEDGFTIWGKSALDAQRRLAVAKSTGWVVGRVVTDSYQSWPSFAVGAVTGAGVATMLMTMVLALVGG
jgi:hypothetical protein